MRYQLERFVFRLFLVAARIMPRTLFLRTGELFGRLCYYIDSRHRSVALKNFAIAFPVASPEQARQTIRACYESFASYLFDILTHFSRSPQERADEFEFEGLDHLKTVYENKKGAILFTAHWGAWELMAIEQGLKGFPLGVLARKLDNPYLESLLSSFRKMSGNWVIEKREGFRPMLKALREGKAIAILIDQNIITEDRIFVDFFGKPASTTPALALLKLKTDASLIPAFALPLPGKRYRFIYRAPIEVPLSGNREEDVVRITQECTRIIEQQIRQFPQYWLWMHRRWKTRPEETSGGGPPRPPVSSSTRRPRLAGRDARPPKINYSRVTVR